MSPKATYEIDLEQIRAQGQAIYESCVLRETGLKFFRDPRTGLRADLRLTDDARRSLISRCMFAIGTGVAQKHGRLEPGSRKVTAKAAAESAERSDPAWGDHLLRNRQDYEETLALARRRAPFYRVVPERTSRGVRYFVWPLPPGQSVPAAGATSEKVADAAAEVMNQLMDPRVTGVWWTPPRLVISAARLAHWLPPRREVAVRRKRVG